MDINQQQKMKPWTQLGTCIDIDFKSEFKFAKHLCRSKLKHQQFLW